MENASFQKLNLSEDLLSVVTELGYTSMTDIQAQSIPLLLEGMDVIGQSKTGSGKTAAFTLPILQNMEVTQARSSRNLQAIILCPTRELCTQVTREVRKLGRKKIGLQVVELVGGTPVGPQARSLENGVHIVVGTPGRVLDHLQRQTLDLSNVKTVVLDEADRMLDMGFQEDIERVLEHIPEQRQTVLFSATFPKSILSLSSRYQHEAVMVKIENTKDDVELETNQNLAVEQIFYEIQSLEDKNEALLQILTQEKPESALIFCNMKVTTFEVVRELNQHGVSTSVLNGDLEQRERDLVMAKFRNQSIRILVATDVAARGIDVADLDLVVNYDLPQKADIYTHRIGRTGRAGKTGKAVAIVLNKEINKAAVMDALSHGGRVVPFERAPYERLALEAKMATLLILEGRKNKMRPGDILGALTGAAGGLQGSDIGKIEIHDFYSYVAVSAKVAKTALERLQNGRIKGRKVRVEWPR